MFRQMNFLKFKADAIRTDLDPKRPDPNAIERAECHLADAKALRDRIVQASARRAGQ